MASMALAFDILARDKASQTLDKVGDSAERSGGKLAGMGKAAATAFAGIGAAGIAGAAKAITAFAGFEQQMNEVFTLLPGISSDAMDSMTGQVKDFSKEFGVLPDQVVPALYQSLSAGVPQDNVFAFLETAQQAAKGGVTDLTTAVDGISSVVNAYGSDVIGATQASDQMFTAVKLGKTNFEQLSASLSNVTPIASALGVQFGDVSAALATMTSKGTPTAVATTQLRSLFVELSKAGGKAASTFEEMAGKTFQQFVSEGGNTADALELMQKAADKSGVALQDMFGSVEAGAAALSLSGGDGFRNNIDAMAESAGATETAFKQMNKGLGPIFDRIKANVSVFFIDIGQRLAPIVEKALGQAGKAFDALRPVFDEIQGGIRAFLVAFKAFDGDVTSSGFAGFMERAAFVARSAFETLSTVFRRQVIPAVQDVARFVTGTLVPGLVTLGKWVVDNKPVLIGIATAIGVGLVSAFVAWATSAAAAAAATIAAAAPVIAIGAAIAALTAGIIYAYQNWDFFRNTVDTVARFLTGTVWPIVQQGARLFTDVVVPALQRVIEWYWNFYRGVFDAMGKVVGVISEKVGAIVGFFTGLARRVGDIASTLWSPLSVTFKGVVNAIIDAWNRLDFAIDIRVPGWVPGIGGKGFKVDDVFPDVPRLHTGGRFTAPFGEREGLAMLLEGERVLDPVETIAYERGQRGAAGGDNYYFTVSPDLLRRPSDIRRELTSARHLTGKR